MKRNVIRLASAAAIFAAALLWTLNRQESSEPRSVGDPDRNEHAEATYAMEAMKWYNFQRAYPTGTIPRDWKTRAFASSRKNNLRKPAGTTALSWSELGPNNIGGRVRSIAFDPANSSIVYCGSVSGGIWKSTNGGTSWNALDDFLDNLVISSIVVNPSNSNILYAATGEGYFNVDALSGIGVLKSTDAGATWTVLQNFATPHPSFGYAFINRLVINPSNTNILYAAMLGGIWETTDAGASWAKLNVGSTSVRAMDLIMHPTNNNILYATFGNLSRDGIYKTTNGGSIWTKLAGGLPTAGYQRINISLCTGTPSTVYAVFDDSASHDTYNIYKSTNDGLNWSVVTKPSNPLAGGSHLGGQGWYNNAVAVHPTDPNTVLIGGINLFKTTNGGTSWTMKTNWYHQLPYQDVHADQHAIAYDPSNTSNVYFGNDGGMYKSGDGGETYSNINNNLSITQFYYGAAHPAANIFYGGAQDNGTIKSGTLPAWAISLGGDGGETIVDQTSPNNVYAEYVWLCIQKSTNAGGFWFKSMTGIPTSGAGQFQGTSDRSLFISPFAMDPSNSSVLYAGTYRVYKTANGGTTWAPLSVDLTGDGDGANQQGAAGSTISVISVAPTSASTIYVGTTGSGTVASKVVVTTNGGANWIDQTALPLPDRYVRAIAIDPTDQTHAIVGFSGYNGNTPTTPGHVFETTNSGTTWSDVSGNLPDIPVNALLMDPANSLNFLAGTDLGVYQSVDGGATWVEQNQGLAHVAIADLEYRANDNSVIAATHGRGMFKLQALTGVNDRPPAIPKSTALLQNYPNPFNPQTEIRYDLSEAAKVTVKVFDIAGREVATLTDGSQTAGSHTVSWDATGVPSGVYFCRLTAGTVVESKKMLLLK